MIRYRIMLVKEGNSSHYEVQRKSLFFWKTLKDQMSAVRGTHRYPCVFYSIKEAKDFISAYESNCRFKASKKIKKTEVDQIQYLD